MKIALILLIPFFYWLYELIKVVCDLEKWKYIYNSKAHSIEHFVYLLSYLVTILLFMATFYTKDPTIKAYFIFMFSFSTIALVRHIQKERLQK